MNAIARLRPLLAGFACAALVVSRAPSTLAQPAGDRAEAPSADAKREASEHFQRGVKFHKNGEYEAALIEFKRAYEIVPNYRVLYNLGQTSRELKDHAGALRYFDAFLAEGGTKVDARKRREVEASLEDLRWKVGRVALTTVPEGAEVAVDDVVVGTTPLPEPLVLSAGRRKVTASLSGHTPVQRYVDVAGAEQIAVSLELAPIAPPPAPPAPPAPPPDDGGSALPWVGLATTGALAIAWGVLGASTLVAQSDFEDELSRRTTRGTVDDARSTVEGLALAADIVGGVTLASATFTVVAFAIDLGGTEESPASDARATLRVGPGSIGVAGRF